MSNRKVRPALEDLRSLLAAWAEGVPPPARRFHDQRADLEQQVSSFLGRWVLRPGAAELASLERQVESLRELVPALVALFRQVEAVEQEVADLRAAAERSPDRELASWLMERCVSWLSTLRRLGSNVGRLAELDQDQVVLDRTRTQSRHHADALRRLDEAVNLLDKRGDKVEAAALKADLPKLRQRLFDEGADAAWLADLQCLVRPVQELVDPPPEKPPQTLQEVDELLTEIRRWVPVLDTGKERAAVLLERFRIAQAEWKRWTDDPMQALFRDTAQLLDDLRRIAAERRAAAHSELRERSRLLAAACGPNLELEQEIDALAAVQAGEPESYEEWMEQQSRVRQRLLNVAGARVGDLKAWLAKQRQDLGARVETLGAEPVTSATARDLERLRVDLEDLLDHRDEELETLFRDLQMCDRIALELDRLDQRVRTDRDAFDQSQQRLAARHERLRAEVARSGIEVADLSARIEDLAHASPGTSLDDLGAAVEALEIELAAREKEFAERCAAWVRERLAVLGRRLALLCRAGRPAATLPEPLADGSTPSQASAEVVRVRELDEDLAGQLEELQRELEVRCDDLRGRLAALPVLALRPELRRKAVELFDLLGEEAWEGAADLEERLQKMLLGLERCDAFLAKLSQDDREAQGKAEDLRQRLRRFNEMDLDRFCPEELVQRASALVAGIPPQPPSWGALADHLETAEELFGRLENHARRVRAARLERAIPDLERQASLSRDPAYAKRLRMLLQELAVRDQRQELPAHLMAQIFILAPEPHGEGDP